MQQALEQYIAAELMRGTQRHFSRLMADYLEIQMSTETQKNTMPSASSEAQKMPGSSSADSINSGFTCSSTIPITVKKVDFRDLKTGEDFRAQAQGGTDPLKGNDLAPRAETNDQSEGVGA